MVFGTKAMTPPMAQRRRRLLMVIGLLAGLGAAALAFVILSDAASDDGTTVAGGATIETVVARRDILPGQEFEETDLALRPIPETEVHNLAFHDVDELLGKSPSVPVYAGTQIISPQLFDGPIGSTLAVVTPNGMRAMSIAVEQSTVAGGLVVPGDRVDVVAVFPEDRQVGRAASVATIVENVEVIAVAQDVVRRDPEASQELQPDAQTITLSVTGDQAQRIALADEVGTIRTVVRPGGEDVAGSPGTLTLDELLQP